MNDKLHLWDGNASGGTGKNGRRSGNMHRRCWRSLRALNCNPKGSSNDYVVSHHRRQPRPRPNTAISIARHGGDAILTYRSGADDAKAVVAAIESLGRKAVALQLDVSDISKFPAFVKAVRSALTSTWGGTALTIS